MSSRGWLFVVLGFISWVLVVALLVGSGCASTLGPVRTFRPPHWPDLESTRASILCAVEAKYGTAIALAADTYDVVETDSPATVEYMIGESGPRPTVVLDSAARTVLASGLRHAVFWHLVPHARGNGWNRGHKDLHAHEAALELDRLAGACRAGAHAPRAQPS